MKPLAVAALIGMFSPIALADSLPPQTVTKVGVAAPSAVTVQGNTSGIPFHTICDSGCGGASAFLDLAVFTAGTTAINMSGGVFDDTLAAITAGKAGAPRMTSKRALHFNLRDNSGNEIPFPAALVSGGFNVNVGNTVTVGGTVTANISGSISNTTFASTQGTSPWVTADNHTTAAAPLSLRLSDGAAFYTTNTATQLPAALDGSGFLKTHEQGTATVSGTVTLGAGSAVVGHVIADTGSTTAVTGNVTVAQATGTNLHAVIDTGSTTAATQATAANLNATVVGNVTPATAQANPTTAVASSSLLSGFNGTTWDRLASAGNNNDTEAVATAGVLDVEGHSMVYNGTSWDRQRGSTSGTVVENAATTTAASALSQKAVAVNTTINVKASAGNVYGVSCANANASVCWIQFYNTASTPTCGTSVIWSLAIPTSGVINLTSNIPLANHATGIGMCMGTTATGLTACTTANACTIFYK